MSLFKRKSRGDAASEDVTTPDGPVESEATAEDSGAEDSDAEDSDAEGSDAADDSAQPAERVAGVGPFDVSEVDGPGERLDVGSLWLPLVDGVELQLQVDEASGQVTGVFVVLGESAVQLQAFAAPRHEGIWREICDEIAAGITEQGGTADPGIGPFGHELLARVPSTQPDGKVGFQPLRFTGVDGSRWLLRAVFHGRAAIEAEAAGPLEALVADVVVVRGAEPMGPRELLSLRLPEGAQGDGVPGDGVPGEGDPGEGAQSAAGESVLADDAPTSAQDLNPFKRGPEITERR